MPEIVVKRNTLENYDASNKELSIRTGLENALKQKFKEQHATIEALKEFLQHCIKEKKLWAPIADNQDLYFSKKEASDFVKILLQLQPKTDQKSLSGYVDKTFQKLDISKYTFTESEKNAFKKTVAKALEQIEKKIDALTTSKKPSASKSTSEKTAKNAETSDTAVLPDIKKLELDFSKRFKKKLKLPTLHFDSVFSFFNDNVFSNLKTALRTYSFSFTDFSGKIIEEYSKNNFYNKYGVWNPKISDLKAPFDDFTSKWTWEASYQIKDSIRRFAKKYTKKLVGFLDMFFPFVFTFKILKFGFKLAKGLFGFGSKAFSFAYKTASKGLSYISSGFKFVANTIKKVGGTTVKYLKKTLDKVSNLGLFKFTKKILFGFLQTPAGAFVLGYVVGTVYKNIKHILEFIQKVKDYILEKFTLVKNWLDKHVMKPFVNPILGWLDKHVVPWIKDHASKAKSAASFYFDLFGAVLFDDEGTIFERIENALSLFKSKDFDFFDVIKKVEETIGNIASFISSNLTIDKIRDFILVQGSGIGGSMLGGWLGAKGGAALGTFIFPGVGTVVGGIIGAIAGGIWGEKAFEVITTALTKKSKIDTEQRSEESKVDAFIRKNFGATIAAKRNKALYEKFDESEPIAQLVSLAKISRRSFELEKAEPELEKIRRTWGIDIKAKLEGAEDETERKNVLDIVDAFSSLEKIKYKDIQDEITETLSDMVNVLDKTGPTKGLQNITGAKITPKGFATVSDIIHNGEKDKWKSTKITLNGEHEYFWDSDFTDKNPYWIKIGRDIAFLNEIRELQAGRTNPFQFIETAESLDNFNLDSFLAKYGKMRLKFGTENHPTADYTLEDLIYGRYFKTGLLGEEFKADYRSYIQGNKDYRQNYIGRRDDGGAGLPSMPAADSIIGYIPIQAKGIWDLKTITEDTDITKVLQSGAMTFDVSSQLNQEEYGQFSEAFKNAKDAFESSGKFNQDALNQNLNEDNVFRGLQQILKGESLSWFFDSNGDEQKRILEEVMEGLIFGKEQANYLVENIFQEKLESVFSTLNGNTSEEKIASLKTAFEHFQDQEGDVSGFGMVLRDFIGLTSKTIEFNDKIIPTIRMLAEKAGIDPNRVEAIFLDARGSKDYVPFGSDLVDGTTEQL